MSLRTDTLEAIDEYQEEKEFSSRSEAFEQIVREREEYKKAAESGSEQQSITVTQRVEYLLIALLVLMLSLGVGGTVSALWILATTDEVPI